MANQERGPLQAKRGSAADWAASTVPLLSGEWGYDETNRVTKVGDGSTLWNDLPIPGTGLVFDTVTKLFGAGGGQPIPTVDPVTNLLSGAALTALDTYQSAKLQKAAQQFMRAAGVSIVPYVSPDGTYEYEVVTVRAGAGGLLSAIEKVYAGDYEKTWTSGTFSPPAIPFASYQAQTVGHVVLSSDAFQGGQMSGLQIKNGIVYRGWGNYSNDARVGQDTLALMQDGTWRTFTKAEFPDPATVVAAGAHTTWGFGPLVVINGAARPNIGDASVFLDWVTELSARHLMGHNATGDLVSILVKGKSGASGIAGVEMANVALRHGLVNAIMLDGGGSVQGIAHNAFHISSDAGGNRNVNDVTAIKAPLIAPIRTPAAAVTYASGYSAGGGAALTARKVNGETRLQGNVLAATVAANTWYTIGTLLPRYWPSGTDSIRDAVYTSNGGYAGVVSISPADGTIQVKAPVAGTNVNWQLDGVRFDGVY